MTPDSEAQALCSPPPTPTLLPDDLRDAILALDERGVGGYAYDILSAACETIKRYADWIRGSRLDQGERR